MSIGTALAQFVGRSTVSGYGEPWWSMREKSAAATNESFQKDALCDQV